MVGIHTKAQKWNTRRHGKHRALGFMQSEPQSRKKIDDLALPCMQCHLISCKQQEVVNVAHIALAAQLTLDELVERIEIDVRPGLRCLVADRQTTRTKRISVAVASEAHRGIFRDQLVGATCE